MKFSTRRAIDLDFQIVSTFPDHAEELFFLFPHADFPHNPEKLKENSDLRLKPTVIMADDEVIGYCNLYGQEEDYCWLGNVIISSGHRGRGAGAFLINRMKETAKHELGLRRVRIVCHNTNTNALLFYNKLGFKPFGLIEVTGYQGNKVAGIKMEAEL